MNKEDEHAVLLLIALWLGSGFVVGATARVSSWWAGGLFVTALIVLLFCGAVTAGFILEDLKEGKKK